MESCTRVASLEELAPFRDVEALGVVHFPKVRSLDPLGEFRALKALVVAGGGWTRMTVDRLAPLASLTGLRFLHLTNLSSRSQALPN